MDLTRFEKFREGLAACLPGAVSQILGKEKGSDFCEIGFITTDDLYGCFITWDTSGCIDEYFDWDQQLEPETDFLYQPLVEVVDACKDIDLCTASPEKWEFVKGFLSVLEGAVKALPDEVFEENGFAREDILFFATMSDGDYVAEMMNTSLRSFNSMETMEIYEL